MDTITATDYHTAGEPFRIVTGGVPPIPGTTVAARRISVPPAVDAVRRLLCHEPRGHADMYGCFLVPPDDEAADLGVLFWHKDGYSTACGHGTIALGAWAVESGRVTAKVRCTGGVVDGVTFRNVPSSVVARDVPAAGVSGLRSRPFHFKLSIECNASFTYLRSYQP